MLSKPGQTALIVGAGIGGLSAAAAVAPFFEQVLVLDRDELPASALPRKGVPQGRHLHTLLAGGVRAFGSLLDDFEGEIARQGAVPLVAGRDIRHERPGYDPFPVRDLGFVTYAASRPVFEHTLRLLCLRHLNIQILHRTTARAFTGVAGRCTGVVCREADGRMNHRPADLVIDASGSGELMLSWLHEQGLPCPEESVMGIDVGYATAVFEQPASAATLDWRGCMTSPSVPDDTRAACLMPLEGQRWILTASGRFGDHPPHDPARFLAFLQGLRTPTLHDAVRGATLVGRIERFMLPHNRRRHCDSLAHLPDNLIALGDAVCRFNPIHAQGMSVAAQQAVALRQVLRSCSDDDGPAHWLDGMGARFFTAIVPLIDSPWQMSAVSDFAYPQTRGQRPAQWARRLAFSAALETLAAADPEVHRLSFEVSHLLRPSSDLFEGPAARRILSLLWEERLLAASNVTL